MLTIANGAKSMITQATDNQQSFKKRFTLCILACECVYHFCKYVQPKMRADGKKYLNQ